jgi:hypothetical protein
MATAPIAKIAPGRRTFSPVNDPVIIAPAAKKAKSSQ